VCATLDNKQSANMPDMLPGRDSGNTTKLAQWLAPAQSPADEMYASHDPSEFGDVLWARCPIGPVFANAARGPVTCYGCDAALSFVKQHKRSRGGIRFDVRPFYRHTSHLSHSNCSNESIEHKAAKDAVIKHKERLAYVFRCDDCGKEQPWYVNAKNCTYAEEVTWNTDSARFQLDVGIVSPEGSVIGAVEILHSHAISNEKVQALTDANIEWCEVTSKRVLQAVQTESFRVLITRCTYTICCECMEKLRSAEFARMDDERDRMARQSVYTMNTRNSIVQKIHTDWHKLRGHVSVDLHDAKWLELVSDTTKFAAERATQLGIGDSEEVPNDVLEGKLLLTFGKYKGLTLEKVREIDWRYTLWLAGYDFGRLDHKKRAVKRSADGRGVEHIPREIECEARDLVSGKCVKCADDIENWDTNQWKTVCSDCWRQCR